MRCDLEGQEMTSLTLAGWIRQWLRTDSLIPVRESQTGQDPGRSDPLNSISSEVEMHARELEMTAVKARGQLQTLPCQ